jgi:hypothetical protein
MSSERTRLMLYEDLKGIVRVESADELIESLPPVGWGEVATKADFVLVRPEMDALRAELRGEMGALRTELRGEMGALRTELRGEMAERHGELAELRADFRTEMAALRVDLQRWTIATLIAMTGLFGAIVFGAVKLSG